MGRKIILEPDKKFEDMSEEELLEAFEVLMFSIGYLYNGFDYVDGEGLRLLAEKVPSDKLPALYKAVGYKGRGKSLHGFEDFFYEHHDHFELRIKCWRETFKRLEWVQKVCFLEENESYYERTLPHYQSEPYDWSQFICVLERDGQTSKLMMIKRMWSELGTQVYGCATADNGRRCPCLRESSTTSAHKCFRDYLEGEGKAPNGAVPRSLLAE